jgi:hypothetical protein
VGLSVIVTSFESPATLHRCLQSLNRQKEVREIVVSDCSRIDPAAELSPLFPRVRFLHFREKHSVPRLRWMALREVTGEIVAAVEARCVPSGTWCQELLAALAAAPDSPVAGGPVAIPPDATKFDWGLYFCEYGQFAPPLRAGPSPAISGANLCYRRAALDDSADLTSQGEWETMIHQRWLQAGRQLTQCGASVTFFNSMSPSVAMRQRWYYGRGYAADRLRNAQWPIRLAYAGAACTLPLLLTWRAGKSAPAKKLLPAFFRSLGWILLMNSCWSAGEIAGYLAGQDPEVRIF